MSNVIIVNILLGFFFPEEHWAVSVRDLLKNVWTVIASGILLFRMGANVPLPRKTEGSCKVNNIFILAFKMIQTFDYNTVTEKCLRLGTLNY